MLFTNIYISIKSANSTQSFFSAEEFLVPIIIGANNNLPH